MKGRTGRHAIWGYILCDSRKLMKVSREMVTPLPLLLQLTAPLCQALVRHYQCDIKKRGVLGRSLDGKQVEEPGVLAVAPVT